MAEWSGDTGLAAIFVSAFLSATVLPGNSEVVLFAVLKAHPGSAVAAIVLATLGNTLGSLTTFALGRALPQRLRDNRAIERMRRHGPVALLLAWVPFVGDALCAAAGWLRLRWLPCTLFIAAGKLARYLVVAYAAGV